MDKCKKSNIKMNAMVAAVTDVSSQFAKWLKFENAFSLRDLRP
jgi:hypothetical protein